MSLYPNKDGIQAFFAVRLTDFLEGYLQVTFSLIYEDTYGNLRTYEQPNDKGIGQIHKRAPDSDQSAVLPSPLP